MKRLYQFSLIVTCALLFGLGADVAVTSLAESQKLKQLSDFNNVALRRSEAAVNFAIVTLDELARLGPMRCDAAALQQVRLHVYQRGSVKDIRAVNRDSSVLCSAYSETLEFDKTFVNRADMRPTADLTQGVRIFRVDQFSNVALGVLKDIDAENALVAIVGVGPYLLDVLPSELHDRGEVRLELDNGDLIAQRLTADASEHQGNGATFTAVSDRYPLRTVIRIDGAVWKNWNQGPYLPVIALAICLGAAFGFLVTTALSRPRTLLAEIDTALAAGEFKPYFQPIFHLESGAIIGCEALARWLRSDGSVIQPGKFIAIAENNGRIATMTWQIMSAGLTALQPTLKRDKTFKVSFNIDPHHFLLPEFIDDLRRVVAATGVSPRQIVLELTEQHELPDLDRATDIISRLREFGFKVALDDVGIGHSGLQHIQRLGADMLKIDKFFVDSIALDRTATAVVEMLVRLAQQLKMNVIAEGIETIEQKVALTACGVAEGQGYLVSPPLPVDEFLAFVDKRRETAVSPSAARRVA